MKRTLVTLLAVGLVAGPLVAEPASAQQRRTDQGEARKEMRAGNILRIREIESLVLPTMRGAEYLGFEYDSVVLAYRLKFIREGRVSFVDVDARSGRIIRRSN